MKIPVKIANWLLTFAVCSLGIPTPARAHFLWMERVSSKDARVYFGEYQEGLREKTGGRLDKIVGLEAWMWSSDAAAPRPVSWEKKEDHFQLAQAPAVGTILLQDLKYEVMDLTKYGIGIVKPMFYSRYEMKAGGNASHPHFELDILPVPGKARGYQVFFQKKPLPEEKVMVYAPNGWMQEFKTDADGKVLISTPWPGQYVVDVVHKEEKDGTYDGRAYKALRHRCTYVVVQAKQ